MLYLDDEQFCRTYGVSRVYTWSQRKKGLLPYTVIGRKIRYSADDIASWLSKCRLMATMRKRKRLGGRRAEAATRTA